MNDKMNAARCNRVVLIVLDSAGVGALPDAHCFGDTGADTLGHIIERQGLELPNMAKLGLFSIEGVSFSKTEAGVIGCFGKCAEQTMAKDTTSGHWELAGYIMDEPFCTYPDGFPEELIAQYETAIGRKVLGNYAESGTQIIARLGEEHQRTGYPIVYTSADSVFQVAAHEEVVPLAQLYTFCEIARKMLLGEWSVGRVIARPFLGEAGDYIRTGNRKDYAVAPESDTVLDALAADGVPVYAIGKIEDIFCHRGIAKSNHTTNNADGIEATLHAMDEQPNGLIFTNLVDFDMLYGHRNDVQGYGDALAYFDAKLPELIDKLLEDDLLIITADHGCDPCFPGTDHTREYIPLLVYSKKARQNVDLGVRATFADVGATVLEALGGGAWHCGESFVNDLY